MSPKLTGIPDWRAGRQKNNAARKSRIAGTACLGKLFSIDFESKKEKDRYA